MIGEINRILKAKIIESYGDQRNFARENAIPEGTVSRVVRRRWNLTPDEQQQWAEALNTSAMELFGE